MSIFDELAVILPAYGGVTIALCCERHRLRFESHDYQNATMVLPLLDALHKLHIDRLFLSAGRLGRDATNDAILILDRRGQTVYKSEAWLRHTSAAAELPRIVEEMHRSESSSLTFGDQQVAHWERLSDDFSLAPGGGLVIIEQRSPDPLAISGDAALQAFCRQKELTPREAEIVRLSFVGLPNAAIAKQLGVSVGTIKNHRWRLYYKLDITTERELFHQFISTLLSIDQITTEVPDF
ncbi:helix-turn-helix transcriptional regulator [Rhizobium sp. KVB221]|uniref:Helix-turn-helix transcriptional regulator n=2 Tax=Rhizobium setariae TaxID=2801340 RepID=A0A936YPJ5_9HYPH|nr:helix-turn-helix transcriptional regulator [Rhizobium setariae]